MQKIRKVKGFYMMEGISYVLKYYCPFCNSVFGVYEEDRCKHYHSHVVNAEEQSVYILDEKSEIIHQIEQNLYQLQKETQNKKCSAYITALRELVSRL